jgi:hypothetical protein
MPREADWPPLSGPGGMLGGQKIKQGFEAGHHGSVSSYVHVQTTKRSDSQS